MGAPDNRTVLAFARECTGDLCETPLAELLMQLHGQQASGSLEIEATGGEPADAIYFDRGTPVAARATAGAESVTQVLLPLCARGSGRFAFHPNENRLGGGHLLVHGPADPRRVITAALRGPARQDAIDRAMDTLGAERFRLKPYLDLDEYGFSADERFFVEALGEAWMTTQDLLICSPLHEPQVKRLLYLLCVTRALTLPSSAHRQTSGTRRIQDPADRLQATPLPGAAPMIPAPAQPSARGPAAATVLEHSPASGLASGVAPAVRAWAPTPEAEQERPTAHEIPRDPPPARPPRPPQPPPVAARPPQPPPVAARPPQPPPLMAQPPQPPPSPASPRSEAARSLGQWEIDRPKTAKGPPHLERGGSGDQGRYSVHGPEFGHSEHDIPAPTSTPRRRRGRKRRAGSGPVDRERAEQHHRKASALVARQSFDRALAQIRAAISADGSNAEYEALHGWLLYELRERIADAEQQAWAHLKRALKLDPRCARAHYYTGMVLKARGHFDQAYEHFTQAAALDPDDLAAQREVRVYEMRQQRERGHKPSGLGRLMHVIRKPD